MLYVKAINNVIIVYPYTQTDLIRDNPSTSFPVGGLSTADLHEWNVFPVEFSVQPIFSPLTERLVEKPPIYNGSSWIQQWKVEARSQAEIDASTAAQAEVIRQDRNKRLADCDWTQLADAPVNAQAWLEYRQSLRDITAQLGFPWDITWPAPPV
jgi:hypothetical protein